MSKNNFNNCQIFLRFLKDNNIFTNFSKRYNEENGYYKYTFQEFCNQKKPYEYISAAFIWKSIKGDSIIYSPTYWSYYSLKWGNYLRKKTQELKIEK